MIKKAISVSSSLGAAAGALSLVLLCDHAIRISWIDSFYKVLNYYSAIKKFLFSPIEPILIRTLNELSQIVDFEIHLSAHWSDVFVLLFLYFGARARSYWDAEFKGRAIFRYVWGLLISLLTGTASGTVPLTSLLSSILMASITLLGIAAFEIGDCAVSAMVSRQPGLTWVADFKRYANFSFPPLYLGGAILLIGSWAARELFSAHSQAAGILLLLAITLVLAMYWLFRGWQHAGNVNHRERGESRWSRFQRSSNTRIGMLMLGSIAGALGFILLNAGLSYVGL